MAVSRLIDRLAPDARLALVRAHECARGAGAEHIGLLHLLVGLLRSTDGLGIDADAVARRVIGAGTEVPAPMTEEETRALRRELRRRGVALAQAEQLVERLQTRRVLGPVELSTEAREVLARATANERGADVRQVLRVLFASPPPGVVAVLTAEGIDAAAVRRALTAD